MPRRGVTNFEFDRPLTEVFLVDMPDGYCRAYKTFDGANTYANSVGARSIRKGTISWTRVKAKASR